MASARSEVAGHVARVLTRMRVPAQREVALLDGAPRVDFVFERTGSKQADGTAQVVVLEVDGPTHFLLELPSGAGAQLSPQELGAMSTIRGTVHPAAVDYARRIEDAFQPESWGALRCCSKLQVSVQTIAQYGGQQKF